MALGASSGVRNGTRLRRPPRRGSHCQICHRQPATHRFDQRVRARLVAAGNDEDVVGAELFGNAFRTDRRHGGDVRERHRRPAEESELEAREVEMPIEIFAYTSAPLLTLADQLVAIRRTRGPARNGRRSEHGRSPDRRRCGSRRLPERRPDLLVLAPRITRLKHGHVRRVVIHLQICWSMPSSMPR